MIAVTAVTASELRQGDRIHDSQRPDFGFPPLRGVIAKVEPGPQTALWLEETGDMRWLVPGQAMVNVRRTT